MSNELSAQDLLPPGIGLTLSGFEKSEQGWLIRAEGRTRSECPSCGTQSSARHSRYWRHLQDLPVQGNRVALRLRLSRWRCRNAECEQAIFRERLGEVVAAWARRTSRVEEVLLLVGHRTGGRAAEFLLKRLAIAVSDDTILRRVKRRARAARHGEQRLRVVGVDDWAWKKGQSYGTILVDLERRTVADLLPQRSAEQLAEWLKQHPEVEVITRDRFGLYAGGARRGAPQARQVADRFHLLLNLREAVEKELARQRRRLTLPPVEEDQVTKTVPVTDSRSNPEVQTQQRQLVAERWRAKEELFARVRALYVSGRRASVIVRETGVGRRRVDKWIRCTQLPPRNEMEPKPTSPRFFAAHLQRRWAEGCHEGPRLLTEIRALGYRGCYSSLAKFLAGWRDHEPELQPKSRPPASVRLRQQAGVHPTVTRQISPLVAAALLSKPRPLLTGWQAAKVDALKKACPDFARMRSLVMSFRGILQSGKIRTLARWMKQANGSGIYGMKRFVRTLKHDLAAVKNALRESWSNGPVEGHINRLKTLKRQMYGRAGFELLRARLLPMSRGSPLHRN
ncbi:MAG: ISL3 family transposase [Terracidiphilus sp.]|jgi:transposase